MILARASSLRLSKFPASSVERTSRFWGSGALGTRKFVKLAMNAASSLTDSPLRSLPALTSSFSILPNDPITSEAVEKITIHSLAENALAAPGASRFLETPMAAGSRGEEGSAIGLSCALAAPIKEQAKLIEHMTAATLLAIMLHRMRKCPRNKLSKR